MQNENPFKKIGQPLKEVPADLKKKVMADVNAVKLLMEVSALFTSNYKATAESLLKTKRQNNN